MRYVLLVRRTTEPARAYLRSVDRPYARVPVAGEQIMLDDAGEQGHVIDQVSWDNDGVAVLRCSDPSVSHRWLLEAGFDALGPPLSS